MKTVPLNILMEELGEQIAHHSRSMTILVGIRERLAAQYGHQETLTPADRPSAQRTAMPAATPAPQEPPTVKPVLKTTAKAIARAKPGGDTLINQVRAQISDQSGSFRAASVAAVLGATPKAVADILCKLKKLGEVKSTGHGVFEVSTAPATKTDKSKAYAEFRAGLNITVPENLAGNGPAGRGDQ